MMTETARKSLYAQCLNREFDPLLIRLREIPPEEMDGNLLQLVLMQSCRWAHIGCIDFIWNKYVRRHNSMLVSPRILCEMGQIALGEGKSFIPLELYKYYKRTYGATLRGQGESELSVQCEYDLLRIKVEMFAKTALDRSFREKWKVFLEDMDHTLPVGYHFSFKDFPELISSYHDEYVEGKREQIGMTEFLFQDKNITVMNPTTLPLLLNIILIQNGISLDSRIGLFQKFYRVHPSLSMNDSILIMVHECTDDAYRLFELFIYINQIDTHILKQLPANAREQICDKLKDTSYANRVTELIN